MQVLELGIPQKIFVLKLNLFQYILLIRICRNNKKAMHELKKQKCPSGDQLYYEEYAQKKFASQKYSMAYNSLSQQYVPDKILCRDTEINQILKFIRQFAASGKAKESLYICGVPGLGKTLSVNAAISAYRQQMEKLKNSKNKIKIINVNCMQLKHPSDIYKVVYRDLLQIKQKKFHIATETAMHNLDSIFRDKDPSFEDSKLVNIKKLIFIDQFDYLKTKDEQILYNLSDWTQCQSSKLGLICISNTINLVKDLKNKISSRFGERQIIFHQYTNEEMEKILLQRIEGADIIGKNDLTMVCKKIAKHSGDIRKCFTLIKKSIQLHCEKYEKNPSQLRNSRITYESVKKAFEEVYFDTLAACYYAMASSDKKVYLTIAEHFRSDRRPLTYDKLVNTLKTEQIMMAQQQIVYVLLKLQDTGLLQIKHTVNANVSSLLMVEPEKVIVASMLDTPK